MPRSFTPLPWKETFRKIPPNVEAVLRSSEAGTRFVVCGEKIVAGNELSADVYRHLDIKSLEDIPLEFQPFIPSPTVGITSFKNATPVEVVQKHLGLIWKTFTGRAPSRGRLKVHPTRYKRQVRHRRLVAPSMSYIAFKRLGHVDGKGFSVFFQITEVLDRSDREGILRCLNLLQENAGVAELPPVETAEAEALRHLNVSVAWELLESGSPSVAIDRLYRRLGGKTSNAARRAQDRLGVLRSLDPTRTFLSTRGLIGYIAVEFCPTLTVFEHLEMDHAMFISRGPAEDFIKLTRPALAQRLGEDIERLVHSKGWEDRLRRVVRLARNDQSAHPGEML